MSKQKEIPRSCIILRGLRGRECVTQKDLAKKIGISPSTLSRIERGKREVNQKEEGLIGEALNTNISLQ